MLRSRLLRGLLFCAWSLAAGLLILALAEAGLRVFGVGATVEPGAPAWMDEETLQAWRRWADRLDIEVADFEDLKGWRRHGTLRWSLAPDVEIEARNIFVGRGADDVLRWTLRTNSHGFRTPEFQRTPKPGTVRVVTVGDSNTMGWLLDEGDSYPRRLEAHLAARLGSPVEVVNLGVGGYTTDSCRRVVETIALDLRPDALVVSCGANDTQRLGSSDAAYAERFGGPLGGLRAALASTRLSALASGLAAREGPSPPRVSLAAFEDNLDAIFGPGRDVPIVFLRVCCCATGYNTRLTEVAERHRVPVVHALPEVHRALAEDRLDDRQRETLAMVRGWYSERELEVGPALRFLFRDGCHLNPLGADLAAEALARELAAALDRASH